MSESIASWITLSALLGSIAWYVYQSHDRNIHQLVMCCASGALCFFGGFLVSGAVMKLTGPFENTVVTSILVCICTGLCVTAHTVISNRKTSQQR